MFYGLNEVFFLIAGILIFICISKYLDITMAAAEKAGAKQVNLEEIQDFDKAALNPATTQVKSGVVDGITIISTGVKQKTLRSKPGVPW